MDDEYKTTNMEYIEQRLPFHALQRYAFNRVRLTMDWWLATRAGGVCAITAMFAQLDTPSFVSFAFGSVAVGSGLTSAYNAMVAQLRENPRLQEARDVLTPSHIEEIERQLEDRGLQERLLRYRYHNIYN